MKKTLKAIVMLLVVAAVVFAAGCAGKTDNAKNENQAASGQVTSASTATPEETLTSVVIPAETSTPALTPAETNENITENATGKTTAQNGTHMSNVQRKREIATNHTLSSDTQSVKQ